MKQITSITFTISKDTTKKIEIILQTTEGEVKATLTCQNNKNLGGSYTCNCGDDRKLFYKQCLTPIFAELVKYKIQPGITLKGEFNRHSLDRIIDISTHSGFCSLRGSSDFCYFTKQSKLSLKCNRTSTTILNEEEIETLLPSAQYVATVFDRLFYL